MSSMYSANDPGFKWSPINLHVPEDDFIQCSVLSMTLYVKFIQLPSTWMELLPLCFHLLCLHNLLLNNLHLSTVIFLAITIIISLLSTSPPPALPLPPTLHRYSPPPSSTLLLLFFLLPAPPTLRYLKRIRLTAFPHTIVTF